MKNRYKFRLLAPSLLGLLAVGTAHSARGQCFQPAQNHSAGDGPISVAVGDFNKDGKPDLVTANGESGTVSVLLGNNDGSFRDAGVVSVGNAPFSVAVGDFNGDGKADLVTANAYSNTASVLLNTNTGNPDVPFNPVQNYGENGNWQSVAVGDFNGDGKPDLAAANQNGNTVAVLLNTGNAVNLFGGAKNFGVGNSPYSVKVGDFNGDGKADLATTNASDGTVSVLLNTGNANLFGDAKNFAVGNDPWSVAVGDFNGDRLPDLAVTNGDNNTVSVLLNTGNANLFGGAKNFAVGDNTNPVSVAVGDFNGDGKPDLATANQGNNTVSVLLGDGTGALSTTNQFGVDNFSQSLAVGDFNGDGKPDLVTANIATVSVLLNAAVPLSVGLSGVPACAGQSLSLTLTPGCTAGPYTVQLSGAQGSFANPRLLGTAQAGANAIALPGDLTTGTGYRVRVVSWGQTSATSAPFQVNALNLPGVTPTVGGVGGGEICPGQSFLLTLPAVCPAGPYEVQLSSAQGSFANPRSLGTAQAGTNSIAVPADLPRGSGYRVRVATGGQTSAPSAPFEAGYVYFSAYLPTVSGAPVCRNDYINIAISEAAWSCPVEKGKVTAQLSGAHGSFANPTPLGVVEPGSPNNWVIIPPTVAAGTGYRVRLMHAGQASGFSRTFQIKACTGRLSAEETQLVISPNPVAGGAIRCRVAGMDNPAFSLTTAAGVGVGVEEKTDGSGEFVLTPRQSLTPGVYVVQASEGTTRLTQRVLVVE